MRVHLIFANIFVGAKHFGSKSLTLTNKLSAEMLRPCKIEMHPTIPYAQFPIPHSPFPTLIYHLKYYQSAQP